MKILFIFYFSKNFVVWKQTNFHIKKYHAGSTMGQQGRIIWKIDKFRAIRHMQGNLFPWNVIPRNRTPRNFSKYIVSHFIHFSTSSNWIFALWDEVPYIYIYVWSTSRVRKYFFVTLGKENHASLYWKMLLYLRHGGEIVTGRLSRHRNSSNFSKWIYCKLLIFLQFVKFSHRDSLSENLICYKFQNS
jgi:hypothetical protein